MPIAGISKDSVPILEGVTVTISDGLVVVKGPNGELSRNLSNNRINIEVKGDQVELSCEMPRRSENALLGTFRAHINNMILGVTKGFETKLEITGVGYRAAIQGKNLQIQLGFSHDVNYPIPDGIAIATPKPTEIVVSGIDKQRVGQVAAEIRAFRPPEPYKGKGVKYAGEFIFRKEGKKK